MEEEEPSINKEEDNYTSKQYIDMMRTLTKVREYVLVGLASNIKARNEAILSGNDLGFQYFQGGLDVVSDLKTILNGFEIIPIKDEKSRVPEVDVMHG